jgi:hypothetical protein
MRSPMVIALALILLPSFSCAESYSELMRRHALRDQANDKAMRQMEDARKRGADDAFDDAYHRFNQRNAGEDLKDADYLRDRGR